MSSTGHLLQVLCESIEICSGPPRNSGTSKLITDNVPILASIEGKQLFLGNKAQYKTKAKEWTSVDTTLSSGAENQIVVHCRKSNEESSLQTYILTRSESSSTADGPQSLRQWNTFGAKLVRLWQRYGQSASHDVQQNGSTGQGKQMHQQQQRPQNEQGRRSHGVFGSSKVNYRSVRPLSVHSSRTTAATKLPQPERFSSDDEDDMDKVALPKAQLGDSIDDRSVTNDSAEMDWDETSDPADDPQSKRQHPQANRRGRLVLVGQKKRLAKSADFLEDDDDDDDALFDAGPPSDMTTPATQRMVTPATGTIRSVKAYDRAFSSSDEEEDEDNEATAAAVDDEENNSKESNTKENDVVKNQTEISRFFQPKSSAHNASRSSWPPHSNTPVTTPPRSTTRSATPPRRHSQQSARMFAAVRPKQSRTPNDPANWLKSSSTYQTDFDEKRRRELALGTSPRAVDDHDIEENDEIVDPATPTRKSEPSLLFPGSMTSRKRRFGHNKHLHLQFRGNTTNYNNNGNYFSKFQRTTFSGPPMNLTVLNNDDNTAAEPPPQRFRGLRNLGNTCYQNASLQMLVTCRTFMSRLHRVCLGNNDKDSLTRAVCSVAVALEQRPFPGPASARSVKVAMDRKTDKFVGYEQRDAHEFLSDLVDSLHEEAAAAAPTKYDNTGQDQPSLAPQNCPTDDFCLTAQVCLKCQSCGYTRRKEEMYRHLSLDIVRDESNQGLVEDVSVCEASVERSLAQFFQPEVREVKCEQCTTGSHAEQTLHILKRPKLLLLHLKRFIVVEKPIHAENNKGDENQPPNSPAKPISIDYVFKKDSARVKMPLTLTLDAFQDSTETDETAQDYLLQSVVYHSGPRASSGHYFADALRRDVVDDQEAHAAVGSEATSTKVVTEDIWYCFDDTYAARRASGEAIVRDPTRQRNAYMLLYTLKDDSPVAKRNQGGDFLLSEAAQPKPLDAHMFLYKCTEQPSLASTIENSDAVKPMSTLASATPADAAPELPASSAGAESATSESMLDKADATGHLQACDEVAVKYGDSSGLASLITT